MDGSFQFFIESPQNAQGHKRSPRLVTSCDNWSILLAVIALIPSHGVRHTALGFLLAAIILCKIHLQSPSMQLSQLAVSLTHTEEYIQETTVETPQSYSKLRDQRRRLCEVAKTASHIKYRILHPEAKAFSWKGFRSLFKGISERIVSFRSLSNEIGECIRCVKDIRTDVEALRLRILILSRYSNFGVRIADTPTRGGGRLRGAVLVFVGSNFLTEPNRKRLRQIGRNQMGFGA
ncbi:hypothetical protein DFH08DRAFT_815762 [Mycena albidolilacea]|uniref:Uncharacterized protein n=1 Tax=Mycena albidolilacea TaxID=1033008 RepID=A0AAD6ZLC2_9AGAR|nr:hypothetical protein DFH08DRAFT_815762 [Mycena albidolilacea]